MGDADLGTLEGLTTAVSDKLLSELEDYFGDWDGTYCPKCGDSRRMQLVRLYWHDRWDEVESVPARGPRGEPLPTEPQTDFMPSLFVALCLQCSHLLTLVAYEGPDGPALVVLPRSYGGLATQSTPESVAYYLDQAQRAHAIGAHSAAVAMYRAALEHLLHDQGYKDGMLGRRIEALMADENPPGWRDRLHPDYLGVINKLGSAAIHANDGDVRQQAVFDRELLREVRELFVELLDEVYEQPHKNESRIARLQQAAGSIKRQ